MISCPLCCGEKFPDAIKLAEHLSVSYKKLRCPLCDIRFDNLMVMIKHLERGCSSSEQSAGVQSAKSENNTIINSAENSKETEGAEMEMSHLADDSDNEGALQGKSEEMETISEDQYLDKNGQTYRRRVVKIFNLWADLKMEKIEDESEDPATPIRASEKKCPLCNKSVSGEHSLRLHLEVTHGGTTHTCCYCNLVFTTEHSLKQHVSQRHSMPYSCVYCNKPFNNLLMAKKHVQCHKRSKKPMYQCEICTETAHTTNEIKQHYREAHVEELQPRDVPTPIAPYKKGSLWYSWRGYTYHQNHTTRSGILVMRCWVDGCWAEVRVPVVGNVVEQGEHTHAPYTWLEQRNEMYNSLRRRCMTETTPIRIIYEEESVRYPEGAKNLPFPEATMRSWQKRLIRKMEDPTLEITLENEGLELNEETRQLIIMKHAEEEMIIKRGKKRRVVQ